MAAAEVNRPLYYCTFGNQKFADKLKTCHELLKNGKHTVGKCSNFIQYAVQRNVFFFIISMQVVDT